MKYIIHQKQWDNMLNNGIFTKEELEEMFIIAAGGTERKVV